MRSRNNRAERDAYLVRENAVLKSKISYSLGSLETLNYLLKNDNPEMIKKNMDHIRRIVSEVLQGLK